MTAAGGAVAVVVVLVGLMFGFNIRGIDDWFASMSRPQSRWLLNNPPDDPSWYRAFGWTLVFFVVLAVGVTIHQYGLTL